MTRKYPDRYGDFLRAEPYIFRLILLGDANAVDDWLQRYPALANARNQKGETPAHCALLMNEPQILDVILSHGANPYAEVAGKTLLEAAMGNNQLHESQLIIIEEACQRWRKKMGFSDSKKAI